MSRSAAQQDDGHERWHLVLVAAMGTILASLICLGVLAVAGVPTPLPRSIDDCGTSPPSYGSDAKMVGEWTWGLNALGAAASVAAALALARRAGAAPSTEPGVRKSTAVAAWIVLAGAVAALGLSGVGVFLVGGPSFPDFSAPLNPARWTDAMWPKPGAGNLMLWPLTNPLSAIAGAVLGGQVSESGAPRGGLAVAVGYLASLVPLAGSFLDVGPDSLRVLAILSAVVLAATIGYASGLGAPGANLRSIR